MTKTTSTLVAHRGAAPMTRAEIALLPTPAPLGPRHAPIRHVDLLEAIHDEIADRGMGVRKESYAVGRDGATLFGVLDLVAPDLPSLSLPETGVALGIRSSVDQSLAIKAVAGQRVFVCDNLALSGDLIAMHNKHTPGLRLATAVRESFDRFIQHGERLARAIARLRETPVTDDEARSAIYDAVVRKVLPLKLLLPTHRNYFEVDAEVRPDCIDRTRWGLHNAFTRAMRTLPPARKWAATTALGKLFGLRSAD